ncbi:4-phosphoerythronate dehydrogenase [Tamilnaduibacter salinus]|uniref:Erythronate-4-phosphate dehydrogenase n=1 Tax=Tamilnaduibacter salinus TaxID=1484056 RepID=A0A2A2I4X5_9GAMM|nr:4-phosphoerythronate dehydrogenase PdxB [Tamilnaduibacter salinus]PAV26789.1 4-phosphoerythronate dehydrogenase [Tamilnaduibacter salinus]
MQILADENIPLLDAFFGDIGTIRRMPGRAIKAADVTDADILLVRSVTRVDADLLSGSRVRFVGTATIGTDHIDESWLERNGIGFAAAPGSNADSVVEYVLSVLSVYAEERGIEDWTRLSVGIVGAGNVGGRLRQRLGKLGFSVRASDPPLADDGEDGLDDLDDVLTCDVITLHTPLTRTGDHATHHLLDRTRLATLNEQQLLINTSRGAVVDSEALRERMRQEAPPWLCLDVWEGEPETDPELAEAAWLMTPHIAGYSQEGKIQGTERIYQAVCRYFGLPVRKSSGQYMPEPPLSKLSFTASASTQEAARVAIRACYDVRCDDARFRSVLRRPVGEWSTGFDRLRQQYPIRREFDSVKIQLKSGAKDLQQVFKALGFKLKQK